MVKTDANRHLFKLRITGLSVDAMDVIDVKSKFIELCEDKLNFILLPRDFNLTIETTRRGTKIVIVEFADFAMRRDVYKRRGGFRDAKIFVNEDLTAEAQRIFTQCRELKKSGKIQNTWTWECDVFVQDRGGQRIPVKTDDDLERVSRQQWWSRVMR